jgi:hypothetical protein
MFTHKLLLAILSIIGLGCMPARAQLSQLQDKSQPIIDQARLRRVYILLKGAEDAASDAVVSSGDALNKTAEAMSFEDLRKACMASAEHTKAAIAGAPKGRRPETFANLKNAELRLRQDREEPHQGHIWYTQQHPEKIMGEIRNHLKNIQEILPTIKPATN